MPLHLPWALHTAVVAAACTWASPTTAAQHHQAAAQHRDRESGAGGVFVCLGSQDGLRYAGWFDIMDIVRRSICTYDEKLLSLPLDADYMVTVVRQDLHPSAAVADNVIASLASWEAFVSFAELLHGTDMNGDGVADFGACFAKGRPSDTHFTVFGPLMAIVAPHVQFNGTAEGALFDPETFEPKLDTPGFRQALSLFKRLNAVAPATMTAVQSKVFFSQGRCATWLSLPGFVFDVQDTGGIDQLGTYGGKMLRIRSPGKVCADLAECPHAEYAGPGPTSGALINRAPFFLTSGTSLAVSAHAQPEAQQIVFDFFNYMSSRSQSTHDVTLRGSFSDPFRSAHLGEDTVEMLSSSARTPAWPAADARAYLATTRWALSHPNAALDLRVPGLQSYMSAALDGAELYVHSGTGTLNDVVAVMTAQWTAVPAAVFTGSSAKAAKFRMLDIYRAQLGLPKQIRLHFHPRGTFVVVTGSRIALAGGGQELVDPTAADMVFYANQTYLIAPKVLLEAGTLPSEGDFSQIRYTLTNAPPGVFVSPRTGVVSFAMVTRAAPYRISLVAVDAGQQTALVEEYTISVRERPEFATTSWSGGLEMVTGIVSTYEVGRTYSIPGPRASWPRTTLFQNPARQQPEDVTYVLQVRIRATMTAATGDFFAKTDGDMSITFSVAGSYDVSLMGIDSAGARAPVRAWVATATLADTAIATHGPGGMDCVFGTKVDETEFDSSFTCDCNGTAYVGNNCETTNLDLAAAAAAVNDNILVLEIIAHAALAAVIVVAVLAMAILKYRRVQRKLAPHDFDSAFAHHCTIGLVHDRDSQLALVRKPKEIKCIKGAHVNLIEPLGSGAFGTVWKAVLDESSDGGAPGYLVAVKEVIDADSSQETQDDLLQEAVVMAQIGAHENLVGLVGVVTRGCCWVVVSYCEHGSLVDYLLERARLNDPVSSTAKRLFAQGIAQGMAHLEGAGFVHCDLAGRNVLVASGHVAKVADFGLSRDIAEVGGGKDKTGHGGLRRPSSHYKSTRGVFPVRWTSPEAMMELKFSSASDVWSFGIVLVEIMQDGGAPYGDMRNTELMPSVMAGLQHPQPIGCGNEAYRLMLRCWAMSPLARPTFTELVADLNKLRAPFANPPPRSSRRPSTDPINLLDSGNAAASPVCQHPGPPACPVSPVYLLPAAPMPVDVAKPHVDRRRQVACTCPPHACGDARLSFYAPHLSCRSDDPAQTGSRYTQRAATFPSFTRGSACPSHKAGKDQWCFAGRPSTTSLPADVQAEPTGVGPNCNRHGYRPRASVSLQPQPQQLRLRLYAVGLQQQQRQWLYAVPESGGRQTSTAAVVIERTEELEDGQSMTLLEAQMFRELQHMDDDDAHDHILKIRRLTDAQLSKVVKIDGVPWLATEVDLLAALPEDSRPAFRKRAHDRAKRLPNVERVRAEPHPEPLFVNTRGAGKPGALSRHNSSFSERMYAAAELEDMPQLCTGTPRQPDSLQQT